MTDDEIKQYVDERIKEAIRSRPPAVFSYGVQPEDELAEIELQQKAMIALLTKLVPDFDRAALEKERTVLETETQADANRAVDDLMGRKDT